MSINVTHQIHIKPEIATYFYDRFQEYLLANPDEISTLTYGAYLGNVVLGSLKLLFEGKVPKIYNPDTTDNVPHMEDE